MNDKLRALVEKWRRESENMLVSAMGEIEDREAYATASAVSQLETCADELAALLAIPPSEAREGDKPVAWIKPDWQNPANYDGKSPVTTYETAGWIPLYSATPPAAEVWQPIETAPKDGTRIDVWSRGERVADARWGAPTYGTRGDDGYIIPGWIVQDEYDCNGPVDNWIPEVTHWRPLPTPPAALRPFTEEGKS